MTFRTATAIAVSLAATLAANPVTAQTTPAPVPSACKQSLPAPVAQPPDGSPPVLLFLEVCKTMKNTGASSQVQTEAYVSRIRLAQSVSLPSRGRWTPFTTDVEQTVTADLQRLRSLGFIATALAEVNDYVFPNGTIGKVVTYHIIERERDAAFVLSRPDRHGVERRDDIDAFRAFLALGDVEKSGRCALPDGTTRAVNTTVTFRSGSAYHCVEVLTPISGSSPVRREFERRVTWSRMPHPLVPLDWQDGL